MSDDAPVSCLAILRLVSLADGSVCHRTLSVPRATLLTFAHDWFAERLQQPDPLVLQEVVDVKDGDAMQAILRLTDVCGHPGALDTLPLAGVLRMLHLSDRFGAAACTKAIMGLLSYRRSLQEDDLLAAVHIVTRDPLGLPHGMLIKPLTNHEDIVYRTAYRAVEGAVMALTAPPFSSDQEAMLHLLFHDLELEFIGPSTDRRRDSCCRDYFVRRLSFEAILHLLQGTFVCRSENSVVRLVDTWCGRVREPKQLRLEQARRLVPLLRLWQVSPAVLSLAVTERRGQYRDADLSWLTLTDAQVAALTRFGDFDAEQRAEFQRSVAATAHVQPPGWYAHPRTTFPSSRRDLEFEVVMDRKELTLALTQSRFHHANIGPLYKVHVFNGFRLLPQLLLVPGKRPAFGVQLNVQYTLARLPEPLVLVVMLSLNGVALESIITQRVPCEMRGVALAELRRVPLVDAGGCNIDAWDTYLVDGALRVRYSIRSLT